MKFLAMAFVTFLMLIFFIGACRILSMTFKTYGKSVTIKNRKLAALLIAYKNTWGISTAPEKRNKMSPAGIFSWLLFVPELIFLIGDWRRILTVAETVFPLWPSPEEKTYLVFAALYYIIGMCIKIGEADRYNKGEII